MNQAQAKPKILTCVIHVWYPGAWGSEAGFLSGSGSSDSCSLAVYSPKAFSLAGSDFHLHLFSEHLIFLTIIVLGSPWQLQLPTAPPPQLYPHGSTPHGSTPTAPPLQLFTLPYQRQFVQTLILTHSDYIPRLSFEILVDASVISKLLHSMYLQGWNPVTDTKVCGQQEPYPNPWEPYL